MDSNASPDQPTDDQPRDSEDPLNAGAGGEPALDVRMIAHEMPEKPFVGLRPFQSDEDVLFFGREQETEELLDVLREHRFVAVIGGSGSGKSSLVRAGLIPALQAGFLVEDRDAWYEASMKPGDEPLSRLAEAIESVLLDDSPASDEGGLLENIRMAGSRAVENVLSLLLKDTHANLLLLVDQFEEIFRPSRPAKREDAIDFVKVMLDLAEQRRFPIYVVMTMRSEFLGECDLFPGLPEALNQSQYLVPRLTRRQLRAAIEGPIRLYGGAITPDLIDRILREGYKDRDQLPVIQHALMRTWDVWDKTGAIDIPHYKLAGTIDNALSRHAEQAIQKNDLEITARIFKRLTFTDAANRQVRSPARFKELVAVSGADAQTVKAILKRFRDDDRNFVRAGTEDDADYREDISHESLIRQWGRLQEWAKEEAESAKTYRRLAETAVRWEKGKAGLWRNPDLEQALNWRKKRQPNKAWAKRYHPELELAERFLKESRVAWRKEQLNKVRGRIALVGLIILALLAWAIVQQDLKVKAIAAGDSTKVALKAAEVAELEALASKAQADTLRRLALDSAEVAQVQRDLARRAEQAARDSEMEAQRERDNARRAEQAAVDSAKVAQAQRDSARVARQEALDSAKVAQQQRDEAQRARRQILSVALAIEAVTQNDLGDPDRAALLAFEAYRFNKKSRDETNSARVEFANEIYNALRQALNGLEPERGGPKTEDLTDWVGGYQYGDSVDASTGDFTAEGRTDGTVVLTNTATGQTNELLGHQGPITALAFNGDGTWLASASMDRTIRLWQVEPFSPKPIVLREHEHWVLDIVIGDDERLVSGSADKTERTWMIDIDSLADELCTLLNERELELKEEDWDRFVGTDYSDYQSCEKRP